MAKLRDACNIKGGYAFKSEMFLDNGIPIIRIGNITENGLEIDNKICFDESFWNENENYRVNKDDILVAMSGATVGKSCINKHSEKLLLNQRVASLSRKSGIENRYLYYFISSPTFIKYIFQQSVGCAQPNISIRQLGDIELHLPDLQEQKRIVNKLDKVCGLIALRKEQLNKLDELVKARFVELFGNSENRLPIGEMCNVTGGYSFKSGDISNDGAIKILQIGNVYLDNVSWETTNYLPEGYDEKYSKFMLNEGDIVVALTRPIIQSLGNVKACIVKSSDLPCLLNQRVGRIVAKNEKTVFLEFIYGCLMTDDFTRYVESCSIGCSQPNISTKDIENYLIPNATYEEQKAYVEFKKQTDKSKLAVQQSLEKLETLKKALMQKYFG